MTVKQPRVRNGKLDPNHTTTGIFLEFTATDRTIWFEDATTGELKSARHAVFDEAHYSANSRPPYARDLMNLEEEHLASPTIPKKLIPDPEHTTNLRTHIIPNLVDDESSLMPTTPIPHLDPLTPTVHTPALHRYPFLSRIPVHIKQENSIPIPTVTNLLHIIPPDEEDDNPSLICSASGVPENFVLSSNPLGHSTDITIPINGNHLSLGLRLEIHTDTDRIILRECIPSTPAARIPKWRSTLRDSTIITVDGKPTDTIMQVKSMISDARKR